MQKGAVKQHVGVQRKYCLQIENPRKKAWSSRLGAKIWMRSQFYALGLKHSRQRNTIEGLQYVFLACNADKSGFTQYSTCVM